MNSFSPLLSCDASSTLFPPPVGVVSVVRQNEGLSWWGDVEERDREPLSAEDIARVGPLKMILKDGLLMDL